MSEDVVAEVTAGYAAWNQLDLDGVAEHIWHEDVVLDENGQIPDAVVAEGRDAVLRRLKDRSAVAGRMRLELVRADKVSEDSALAHLRVRFEGTGSGVGLDFDWWQLVINKDGRTIRFVEYANGDEARAAVGL